MVLLAVAAFAAGAVVTTALAGNGGSSSKETRIISLRPTGIGLPVLGGDHTFGVTELASEIRRYHDSGEFDADLNEVGERARRFLRKQLGRLKYKRAKGTYQRCRKRKGKRRCNRVKPAIVLDIDDTSLSNYKHLEPADFDSSALVTAVIEADSPPIQPTLKVYRYALGRDVGVFFITGRPPGVRSLTEQNLELAGYDQFTKLAMKPGDGPTVLEFKSGERKRIQDEGYTILVNVGDQDSDLNGGRARRAFKLPNPMYFIPDAS